MDKFKHLKPQIENTPHLPGIYKFLNEEDKVLYVGKAKDLKKRVSSYFNKSNDERIQLPALLEQIEKIEYLTVDNEVEALLLETNLIKKLKPKYNILMKDDKNFVYVKITTQKDTPKIYVTRKLVKDKATYIGPYISPKDLRKTFKLLTDLLPYPQCELNIPYLKTEKEPDKPLCIIKEIDKAHSPCICDLEADEYHKIIQSIINFLNGKHDELLKSLQEKMQNAALDKKFEKAAKLRDRLLLLNKILEKQKVTTTNLNENIDVIDIIRQNNKFLCNIFFVREGKIINNQNLQLSVDQLSSNEDEETNINLAFQKFIQFFYTQVPNPPKEILIPEKPTNKEDLENFISQINSKKIKITIPQKGRKNELIKLASKNVENFAKQMKVKWLSEENRNYGKISEELKEMLKLKKPPKRIECYDISHLQGQHTVASMVVFKDGLPDKSNYRIFNIKSLEEDGINDFQSMQEVIARRLKYLNQIPKTLKTNTTAKSFKLKNSDKEILTEIEFKIENKAVIIEQIKTEKEVEHLIIPSLIKILKKHKLKKILTNIKLDQFNFQEINNSDYKYGFYLSKVKSDPSFSEKPDIIIIDGGKGQLSSSLKSKKQFKSDIPFISLAKRQETIFLENKDKIQLPDNSPTRLLIQQLRDEAHRFAITNNRKRRQKKMIKNNHD